MSEQQTVIELNNKIDNLANLMSKLMFYHINSQPIERQEELSNKIHDFANMLDKHMPVEKQEEQKDEQQVEQKDEQPVKKQYEKSPKLVIEVLKNGLELRRTFHPNGKVCSEICINPNTELETMPNSSSSSSTYYDENGKIIRKEWKKEGKYYRATRESTVVCFNPLNDEVIERKWLDENGKYHREDGPAHILYDENGLYKLQEFLVHGDYSPKHEWHRIEFSKGKIIKRNKFVDVCTKLEKDTITYERFNSKGQVVETQRRATDDSELPNFELRDHDGTILEERWEEYNPIIGEFVIHRYNKPALIAYHKNKPYVSYYFENGTFISSKYHDIPE